MIARREDHKATRPSNRVRANVTRRERDQITGLQRPLATRVTQHGCAGEHVEPLLNPVVVVVGPDPPTRLALIQAGANPFGPKHRPECRATVPERTRFHWLVQLHSEQVDLPHAHHLSTHPTACCLAHFHAPDEHLAVIVGFPPQRGELGPRVNSSASVHRSLSEKVPMSEPTDDAAVGRVSIEERSADSLGAGRLAPKLATCASLVITVGRPEFSYRVVFEAGCSRFPTPGRAETAQLGRHRAASTESSTVRSFWPRGEVLEPPAPLLIDLS